MELPTDRFEQWVSEQAAREQKRISPVLNHARTLIDKVIDLHGSPRPSLYGNEKAQAYSFSVTSDEALNLVSDPVKGFLERIWSYSTNPLMRPEEIVCHLLRSDRTIENFTCGLSFREILQQRVHVLTLIFGQGGSGTTQASINEAEAKIKSNTDSLWRPFPSTDVQNDRWLGYLQENPEARARLVLQLTKDFTGKRMIAAGNAIPQEDFGFSGTLRTLPVYA